LAETGAKSAIIAIPIAITKNPMCLHEVIKPLGCIFFILSPFVDVSLSRSPGTYFVVFEKRKADWVKEMPWL
jgi:hypothetical protein